LGLVAAAYAIQATLRMRDEEAAGRAEPVLGTAIGRFRWLASHLVFALLGPAAALAAGGLVMGLTHGMNTHAVAKELPRVLSGAMVQLPAVWVLAAITIVLYGLLPRFAAVGWGALAVCLLVGWVGSALGLRQWVLDISPFTHLPRLPGGDISATPLVVLIAVAVVLAVVGLTAFRRRDVPMA
jgi:ABC-2 type transport system permease protein